MSTKRKKRSQADSASKKISITTPAGKSEHFYTVVFTISIPISETEVTELNLGVCAPCKKAKSRCRFLPDATICNKCQSRGLTECTIEPPKPRSRGTPSHSNSVKILPSKSHNRPTKHPRNSIEIPPKPQSRPTKHPRLPVASHSSHSHQTLNSIVEEDELPDSFVSDFEITAFPEHNHTRLTGKARFIDALAGSDNDEEGGGSDTGMEDLDEEIDIDVSSGDSSEGELEDEDLSLSQPVKRQRHSHSHSMKPVKTQSRGSTKPRRTKHEPNSYDPSKCRKWPN